MGEHGRGADQRKLRRQELLFLAGSHRRLLENKKTKNIHVRDETEAATLNPHTLVTTFNCDTSETNPNEVNVKWNSVFTKIQIWKTFQNQRVLTWFMFRNDIFIFRQLKILIKMCEQPCLMSSVCEGREAGSEAQQPQTVSSF